MRTIKESCLDRMILFGEGSLRKVIREFVAHYLCSAKTSSGSDVFEHAWLQSRGPNRVFRSIFHRQTADRSGMTRYNALRHA